MKSTFTGLRYVWKSQDLRRKLIVTLVILVIFRLAANIPVPGINSEALKLLMSKMNETGSFVAFLDLLSGGTVSKFSLLSMGVYPYITAQIILQLLTPIFPALQRKMEEDPREGRKWQEKWTYYLAVPMAALSAIGQINIFNSYADRIPALNGAQIVPFGFNSELWLPSLAILLAMIGGTMFAIWLGELISEYGIRGQGLSLIIFAGIVSQMPNNFVGLLADETYGWILVILTAAIMAAVIFAIVYVQQGRRYMPVMYPGRRVGNKMSMPVKGTLPLMVNMAGMIPLIFASAFLQFPAIIASYFANSKFDLVKKAAAATQNLFGGGTSWVYWLLYFVIVVSLTFFYTDVLFAQQNYGENLKKHGAQIPGINRGAPTQKYLTKVQRRITLPGALFLGLVAVLPYLINLILKLVGIGGSSTSTLFLVSSAGLLIVVGVVRDTFLNIDAELKIHGYDDARLVK